MRSRRRRQKSLGPRVGDPDPRCVHCGGTGWAYQLVGEVKKLDDGSTKQYAPNVARCGCCRVQTSANEEPTKLDHAQRAAGEKDD